MRLLVIAITLLSGCAVAGSDATRCVASCMDHGALRRVHVDGTCVCWDGTEHMRPGGMMEMNGVDDAGR